MADITVVIHCSPIDGSEAYCQVQDDYIGNCSVTSLNTGKVIGVLPDRTHARNVASYALTPDGGYGETIVKPSALPVTHDDLMDWIAN